MSTARSPMRRLFLVGCQRSGTTALQAEICRRAAVLTLPETWYFLHLLKGVDEWMQGDLRYFERKWKRRMAIAQPRTHRLLRQSLQSVLDPVTPGLRFRPHLTGRAYIGELVRVLDAAAAHRQYCAWLEKTPEHFAYLDIIGRHIPDARVIHIIRNGEDVVASAVDGEIRYARQRAFRGGVAFWVERWNRAAETHLRFAGQPGHLVVRYEDLIEHPQATVIQILDFIGVPATAAAPSGLGGVVAEVHAEPWKSTSVGERIRPPQRKFESLFGPELQQWLRRELIDYAGVWSRIVSAQGAGQATPAPAPPSAGSAASSR